MGLESFKYIICDNKKRPQHSFQVTHTYDEVKDKDNLAIKLEYLKHHEEDIFGLNQQNH